MKTVIILYILLFTCSAQAQNLVPNPSFEQYDTCPFATGLIHLAPPWTDPNQTGADFLHGCQPNPAFSVPQQSFGYQYPRTGNGYAGINLHRGGTNTREYIQCKLLRPLEAGKKYCVSFYINLSNSSPKAVNQVGAYFSAAQVSGPFEALLPYSPQVSYNSSSVLKDTLNWMMIQGELVAAGGEEYMTIGNFMNDQSTQTESVNTNTTYTSIYYYIDDVSVRENQHADAGDDHEICAGEMVQAGTAPIDGLTYSWWPSEGLSDSGIADPIAYPLVTTTYYMTISDPGDTLCIGSNTDSITITIKQDCKLKIKTLLMQGEAIIINGALDPGLSIYDMRGRLIYSNTSYDNTYSTTTLAPGIYILHVEQKSGIKETIKLSITN